MSSNQFNKVDQKAVLESALVSILAKRAASYAILANEELVIVLDIMQTMLSIYIDGYKTPFVQLQPTLKVRYELKIQELRYMCETIKQQLLKNISIKDQKAIA